ncbi:MAG: glycosyltransferase family 4 protein, partial [Candidatus Margulisbacteria bacterium]|nr:glycosyltransferase family 4 protein [Candidatus Margulisiibacteriota bacterium]
DVSVITRVPRYNVADGTELDKVPAFEEMSGVNVYRYQTPPLARDIPLVRGLEHFIIALVFFFAGLKLGDFDVILVYSPPLPLGITGFFLGKVKGCPVVVNIQDLYPQTVIDLGLLKNPALIKISKMIEQFIYKNSNAVTVHSEGNHQYVLSQGSAKENTYIVHNWVDTDLIRPAQKENPFSIQYGLKDKFVVSFAGVMGFAQGLNVVIEAAEILKDKKEIVFVLVGDGVKRPEIVEQARQLGLANVLFVKTVPRSDYPQILHASDVCLVTLSKSLVTPVVPGKLLSIMAAGRPVITSLPLEGDTPKIVQGSGCGISVPPEDPAALAEAVLKLYNNKELAENMGENGRKAAEELFSRTACVSRYGQIFSELITK